MLAIGRPRRADQAAQFHQGLIESSAVSRRQDRFGQLPQQSPAGGAGRIAAKGDQPAEQSHGVGLEDRGRRVERDRHDRAGRVAANARQLADGFQSARKSSGVLVDHHAGRGVHLPGAAIIAEPFPLPQHLAFVGARQRSTGGKPGHEPLEVGHDRGHLGLLQHDFADPDRIGIVGAPPGKIAPVTAIPGRQLPGHSPFPLGGG